MKDKASLLEFYRGKKVLVTGHTGFTGTWLCQILLHAGADVIGYALEPPTDPNLFSMTHTEKKIQSVIGDIRELRKLNELFFKYQPEIVFHMAAQPIVRQSYRDPVGTYETNVMGTVNICECVRNYPCVKSFLNVTTDKVYQNKEWEWGYRETDRLDGFDPYSNSKSCSELVTHSYINSFYQAMDVAVSTVRAGNVIGGGDFSIDRIIPDCVRAAQSGQPVTVRNPEAVRPYQHVLEPLFVYLMIGAAQYQDKSIAGFYNVGPAEKDCVSARELVSLFCDSWGNGMQWSSQSESGPHEAGYLTLDCSRIKKKFGWSPCWGIKDAVEKTVQWSKVYLAGNDVTACMLQQIDDFIKSGK